LVAPDPNWGAPLPKPLGVRGEDEAREGASIDPADALAAPVKPIPAHLVAAPAEALPFPDDTFDTAAATLVLCTIPDPVAAIDELARVLKPGGRLLFIEHVRAADPSNARWQDRLEKPWRFLADGCHCNRDTEANLRASLFKVEEIDHTKMPKAAPIVRPLIRGTAVAP
jgi:SAM-dependent methyltransferase